MHAILHDIKEHELEHSISYKSACAPNEDLDQPLHPLSLISLRCLSEDALDPCLSTECPHKTDQTVQMQMMI